MFELVDYFKQKYDLAKWEELQKKLLECDRDCYKIILRRCFSGINPIDNTIDNRNIPDVISAYQKLRRMDKDVVDHFMGEDYYDGALKLSKELIDQFLDFDLSNALPRESIKQRINDANCSVMAILNCKLLPCVVNEEAEIDRCTVDSLTGRYHIGVIPTANEIFDNLARHIANKATDDFMSLYPALDDYGLCLAFMHSNKMTGITKEDWDLYWQGIDTVHRSIPCVMSPIFPAIVSMFNKNLYDVDPILEHVTNSLYSTLLGGMKANEDADSDDD